VMVTCPPGASEGQKIRFQLPIHLTSDQLETFKLSYDKDGWMRFCPNQSLKILIMKSLNIQNFIVLVCVG